MTTSAAAADAARLVLTEPDLLRAIAAWQTGVPLALLAFASAHRDADPELAKSWTEHDAAARFASLAPLIAHKGDLRQLQLVARLVRYRRAKDGATSPQKRQVVNLSTALAVAVRYGRTDMVHWMLARGVDAALECEYTLWETAARYFAGDFGVLETLKRFRPNGLRRLWNRRAYVLRAFRMPLALMRWLRDNCADVVYTSKWFVDAASRGDLGIVQYFHEELGMACTQSALYSACTERRNATFLYLLERFDVDQDHGRHLEWFAANSGNLTLLQLLHHTRGLRHFDEYDIAPIATTSKHLDVLRFLHQRVRSMRCSHYAMKRAAQNEDIDVIQFLHETRTEHWSPDVMDAAAEADHWHIVRFLLENRADAECTTRTMDAAAKFGRLDMLRLLHEQRNEGCTTRAMDLAAERGHLHVVQFLHANRSEGCTMSAMDDAAGNGHIEIVRFLHSNRSEGCTSNAIDRAAQRGHLAVVKFLHEHRTEGCTTNALDQAAYCDRVDVVQFLAANRSEGITAYGVHTAVVMRRHAVVGILYAHFPHLFQTETMMQDLLLGGAFDVWRLRREQFPADQAASQDADGAEAAMEAAGAGENMRTIAFLCDVMQRTDIVHLAMNNASIWSAEWILTLHAKYPDCVRFTAVRKAIDRGIADASILHFLIDVCTDASRADAVAYATQQGKHELVAMLENSSRVTKPNRDVEVTKLMATLHPLDYEWNGRGRHLVCLAIVHDRREELASVYRVSQYPENVDKPEYSFAHARSAAIRYDKIEILKWLMASVSLAIEPTLLDEALSYERLDMVELLATHYPDACLEFGGKDASAKFPNRKGLTSDALSWVESNAAVRAKTDFGAIAAYAADRGDVVQLQHLCETYPAACMARRDIMDRAAGSRACVSYLLDIGYSHCSSAAMETAIDAAELDVMQLLLVHHREACSDDTLVYAASKWNGSAAVKFLLLNGVDAKLDAAIEVATDCVELLLLVYKRFGGSLVS